MKIEQVKSKIPFEQLDFCITLNGEQLCYLHQIIGRIAGSGPFREILVQPLYNILDDF